MAAAKAKKPKPRTPRSKPRTPRSRNDSVTSFSLELISDGLDIREEVIQLPGIDGDVKLYIKAMPSIFAKDLAEKQGLAGRTQGQNIEDSWGMIEEFVVHGKDDGDFKKGDPMFDREVLESMDVRWVDPMVAACMGSIAGKR